MEPDPRKRFVPPRCRDDYVPDDTSLSSDEEEQPLFRRGSESMEVTISSDDVSSSHSSASSEPEESSSDDESDESSLPSPQPVQKEKENTNLTQLMVNRQIYGRFTKNTKGKTERILFPDMDYRGHFDFTLTNPLTYRHEIMGFTLCGRYLLSFTVCSANTGMIYLDEYNLYVWRFTPELGLKFISKRRIFKDLKYNLVNVTFMQAPNDYYRVVCYGLSYPNANTVHISVVTMPCEGNCKHCNTFTTSDDQSVNQGWCEKHGYSIDYNWPMSQPYEFNPQLFLAYPDYIILHTGHHIHLLSVTTVDSQPIQNTSNNMNVDEKLDDSGCSTHSDLDSSQIPFLNLSPPVYSPSSAYFPYYSKTRKGLVIATEGLKYPKWARKIVRKYSRKDFQAGELLSGQIKDDNDTPVEVPVIIQMSFLHGDEQLDQVLDTRADQLNEVQLITTQKTFDCEQFIYNVSQKLCADANVNFCYFQKYYIEIIHVYPENNHILCKASVMIVTENHRWDDPTNRVNTAFLFLWDIQKCEFILEETARLYKMEDVKVDSTTCRFGQDPVWVLSYNWVNDNFRIIVKDRYEYFKLHFGLPLHYTDEDEPFD